MPPTVLPQITKPITLVSSSLTNKTLRWLTRFGHRKCFKRSWGYPTSCRKDLGFLDIVIADGDCCCGIELQRCIAPVHGQISCSPHASIGAHQPQLLYHILLVSCPNHTFVKKGCCNLPHAANIY